MANSNPDIFKLFGAINGYGRRVLDFMREDRHSSLLPAVPWWWDPCNGDVLIAADFTAGATSKELDLNVQYASKSEFPSNSMVIGAQVQLIEAFAGGAVSACTIELGDTGDPDELILASNVFTGAALGLRTPSYGAKFTAAGGGSGYWESAYVPTATLRTTGANTSALTAGKLRLRLLVIPSVALATS